MGDTNIQINTPPKTTTTQQVDHISTLQLFKQLNHNTSTYQDKDHYITF